MPEIKKMAKVESDNHSLDNLNDAHKSTTFQDYSEGILKQAKKINFLEREIKPLEQKKSKLEDKLYDKNSSQDAKTKFSREIVNIEAVLNRKKTASRAAIRVETTEELIKLSTKNGVIYLCTNNEKIYCYIDTHWNEVNENLFRIFIEKFALKLGTIKYIAKDFKFVDELMAQFKSQSSKIFERDQSSVLVNFQNGTFNIKKQKLYHHTPNDDLTYVLGFKYDSKAAPILFFEFLNEVLPDKQKQNILAEFIASVFISNKILKLEKMLLLYGQGANGKSVIFEIVKELLGDQNIANHSLDALTDKKGYSRAELDNKLLNYSSEISQKLNVDILKQLASGETIEARVPYGKPFFVSDYAKFMFNTNSLPKDVEHTHGFFRRFIIIHFDKTISREKQDKQLATKIINNELPGVFNWVLDGLKRLLKNKDFSECKSIDEIIKKFKMSSDSVGMYLNEANANKSLNHYTVKYVYGEYRKYCIESGYKTVNKVNFEQRLEHHGYTLDKVRKVKSVFIQIESID